ncbi:MAG: hypothetical protein MnENMB40S_22580 [Rhizobiaceae bacterium MnEN-MB40S]|nr:MAG: hypothetical protein MnENMB40S_22580 [Rhizobiaceae bacterium MnEN-MB40S]
MGDTIDNVLNDAETVSDFRHALCHGFIEINENSDPKTISVKKRTPEDQTMLASYTVTLDELHEYGENLLQATLFICGLHEVLEGYFGKSEHSVEKVLRKFLDERAGSLPS